MAALEQQATEFKEAMRRAEHIVKGAFPIDGRRYQIHAQNFHWTNAGSAAFGDLTGQKDAKQKEKNFSAVLRADVALTDGASKVIEVRKNHPILEFPHLTRSGGYIINGQERQIVKQMLLRPGMYGGFAPNGDAKVMINTSAAGAYKVELRSATGNMYLALSLTNIPIYSALKALGASDDEIRSALGGSELYEINRKIAKPIKDTENFYRKLRPFNKLPDDLMTARKEIAEFMASKPLDPAVNRVTMGVASERIDKTAVLAAVRKAIALSKKEVEEDDTESMSYKSIMGLEDFIEKRLTRNLRGIQGKVKQVLNKSHKSGKIPTIIETIPPSVFSNTVMSFFSTSDMSRYGDQNNPVDILGTNTLITAMGEDGIQSVHAIKDELRSYHPTHVGVLDPVATPEGSKVGITSHLTDSVRKIGNRLYLPVFNAKTGKRGQIEVGELEHKVVAFPDQYENSPKDEHSNFKEKPQPKQPKVKVRADGTFKEVPASQVNYIFADTTSFFSSTTLAVPFTPNNHANRVLMGDKHISQTVPLVDPDVPLVQHAVRGVSYDKQLGEKLLAHAPVAGQITRITADSIRIRPKSGPPVTIPIYNNYPLNSKTFLTDRPIVRVGDTVVEGQRLTDNTFTKDGHLALGKNLSVAYVADRGRNFEDAVVLSESAAGKLTSEHKYEFRVEKSGSVTIGAKAFSAAFPTELASVRPMADYDSDGVIKIGVKLKHNQVVIPAIRKVEYHPELDLTRLRKSIGARWTDISEVWDHDYPGEVVDVIKTGKMVKVYIKSKAPMQVGDKLSSRHGAKGIVSMILPDKDMFHDEAGKPIDLLISGSAVPGRVNTGQMLETAAGKLAVKSGKTYSVDNFNSTDGSTVGRIRAELKAAGLKDAETITDPTTGRKIAGVLVGPQHILKLKHMVSGKISGRNTIGDAYTTSEQPGKGGSTSAQRIGALDTFSLLSGDATAFLHDVFGVKGQRNDDYWMALQTGTQPPPPKTPLVAEKFIAMLLASGMDLKQDGYTLRAMPLTDNEVKRISHGVITNPTALKANTLAPERGGLFDKAATGGTVGSNWSHIELETPVVNPLLVDAVVSLGNFKTKKEYEKLMNGALSVSAAGVLQQDTKGMYTGAEGMKHILASLDLDKESTRAKSEAKTRRGAARDKAFRKLRYIKNLKELDMKPEEAYIQHVLPVLPPKFRQITAMDDGTLSVADANHGYREVLLINEQIKQLRDSGIAEDLIQPLKTELSKAAAGLSGTHDPVTRAKNFQGMIGQIKGRNSSKEGFFQKSVAGRTQDLSARSTIIPNPKMHMDEIGVPREMARKLYRPFVIRRMTTMGFSPNAAKDLLDNGDAIADRALEIEMQHRPVYGNRAPSLHKFSIQAFKPRLIDGKAVEINPLIVGGMNADFDGDTMGLHVPVSEEARNEALERMLPSKHLFSPKDDAPMHVPSKEAVHGIYLMTRPTKGTPKPYKSEAAAVAAYQAKLIDVNSPIAVGGETRCVGQLLFAKALPESAGYTGGIVDRKALDAVIVNIGKTENTSKAADVISHIKDLGNHYVTEIGWGVSLKDLEINTKKRDTIMDRMRNRIGKVGFERAASDAQVELELLVAAAADTNKFSEASYGSKALGKGGQLTQMIAAPVAFMDHKNRIIPLVVGRSYAEGQDIASYLGTIPGSRKGLIDKGLSVADTGYASRLIVNSNIETKITMQDCGTDQGQVMQLSDSNSLGRFITKGANKGQLLTDALRRTLLKNHKTIEVRSPMHCKAASGICAMCFGEKAGGGTHRVGFHIGALAGQTIGERATQLTLRNFHTGGAIGNSNIGFDRVKELLEMPQNIKGKATLSETNGIISRIEEAPAGGQYIYVDQTKHFVPAGQKLGSIRVGKIVKSGDILSTGPVKPQELLETTGDIHRVRNYVIDELSRNYDGAIKRRIFETAIKPLTDRAKITNPGDGESKFGVSTGDVMALGQIEHHNEDLRKSGLRLIQFESMVFGIKKAPMHSDDFIVLLSHQELKRTLSDAPAFGLTANMRGGHPITELALHNLRSIRQVKGR